MDQQQNFHQQQQEEVLGYLSVCNYTARNYDQLTLKEHEVVEILDQGDSTYYLVRKYDPKQDIFQYGWVPICILEKREDFLQSTDNLRISEVMHHIRSHICDLTESERQYIQNLECFITSVQDSLTHPNCPLSVKRNTSILLSTIQKIANFHRRLFLHELKKSSDNLQMLGDTFIVNKQQFSLYIDYFTDMNQCEVLFGTQPEIVAFLDDWLYRMTRVDDRPLMFYLTRPIERLEYYREFFKRQVKLSNKEFNDVIPELVNAFGVINNVFNQIRYKDLLERVNDIPLPLKLLGDVLRFDQIEVNYNCNSWEQQYLAIFRENILFFRPNLALESADLEFKLLIPLQQLSFIKDNLPNDERLIELEIGDKTILLRSESEFQKRSISKSLREALLKLGFEVKDIGKCKNLRYSLSESSMERDSIRNEYVVEEFEVLESTTDVDEDYHVITKMSHYAKRNIDGNEDPLGLSRQYKATRYDYSGKSPQSEDLQIIIPLENQRVKDGSSTSLRCVINKIIQASHAIWYKDGLLIPNSSDFRQNQRFNEFELIIKHVRVQDSGNYSVEIFSPSGTIRNSCLLHVIPSYHHGRSLERTTYRHSQFQDYDKNKRARSSSQVRIVFQGKAPTFDTPLYPVSTQLGKSATLCCRINADPSPSIQWWKDDVHLLSEFDSNCIFDYNEETHYAYLTIPNVQPDHAGFYTLKLRNKFGEANSKTKLDVYDEQLQVNAGSNAYLHCPTNIGSDNPVVWFKETVKVEIDENKYCIVSQGSKQSLLIKDVNDTDQGIYTCWSYDASRGGKPNNQLYSVKLSLMIDGNASDSSTELHTYSQNKRVVKETTVNEHETAIFRTKTIIPVDELTWLHNGRPISTFSPRIKSHMLDDYTHELIIRDTSSNDEGRYCAQRRNLNDRVVEEWDVGLLTVIETDTKDIKGYSSSSPILLEPLSNQTVNKGDNCCLSCVLDRPNVNLHWYKSSNMEGIADCRLFASSKYLFSEDRSTYKMMINDVSEDDQGFYHVVDQENTLKSSAFVAVTGISITEYGKKAGESSIKRRLSEDYATQTETIRIDRMLRTEKISMRTHDTNAPRLQTDQFQIHDTIIHEHKPHILDYAETSTDYKVFEGDTLTIRVQNNSILTLLNKDPTCLKCNGHAVDRSLYSIEEQSLIFKDITLNQSGFYEITIPDQISTVQIGRITIEQRPIQREILKLAKTKYIEGETLNLECEFQVDYKRKPCWYKGNQQIVSTDSSGHYRVSSQQSGRVHTLAIPELRKSDEGSYELRCGNLILSTPFIKVLSKNDLRKDQIFGLGIGDTLNVDVKTNHPVNNLSSIKVFKDRVDITNEPNVNIELSDSNTLNITFTKVNPNNSGTYYLEIGGCRQYLCTVEVKSAHNDLDFRPVKPKITANAGEDACISFYNGSQLSEEYVTQLKWFRNNQPIPDDSEKYNSKTSSNCVELNINNVRPDDSGYYSLKTDHLQDMRCSPVLLEVHDEAINIGIVQADTGRDLEVKLPSVDLKASDGVLVSIRRVPGTSILDKTRCFIARNSSNDDTVFCVNAIKPSDEGKYEIVLEDPNSQKKWIFYLEIQVLNTSFTDDYDTDARMMKSTTTDKNIDIIQRKPFQHNEPSKNVIDIGLSPNAAKIVRARVGESVTIQMEIKQSQEESLPKIVLLKDGKGIPAYKYTVAKDNLYNSYSICLDDLLENDSGTYSIDVGDNYVIPAVELIVLPRPHQIKLLDLKKTTFQQGETFQLDVDVTGPIHGHAIWLKDGKPINETIDNIGIKAENGKYTMKVSHITSHQSGVYSLCLDNLELQTPYISVNDNICDIPCRILNLKEHEDVDLEVTLNNRLQEKLSTDKIYKDSVMIPYSIKLKQEDNQNNIANVQLKSVKLKDSGIYSFLIDDQLVAILDLRVSKRDKVVKQLDLAKTVFYEGDMLQIDVTVDNLLDDVPEARWLKGYSAMKNSDRLQTTVTPTDKGGMQFTIQLRNLSPNVDSGVYALSLNDDYLFHTPYLTVLPKSQTDDDDFEKNKMLADVKDVTAYQGESIELSLSVSDSRGKLRLFHDGVHVELNRFSLIPKQDGNVILKLNDLKINDSGKYNLEFADKSQLGIMNLIVKSRPVKVQTLELERTNFQEGETLQIDIGLKDFVPVQCNWMKDGKHLKDKDDDRMLIDGVVDKPCLKIENIKPSDSGVYELHTKNANGDEVILKTPPLTITRMPSSHTAEDTQMDLLMFTEPLTLLNKNIQFGEPIVLQCAFNYPILDHTRLLLIKDDIPCEEYRDVNIESSNNNRRFKFVLNDSQPDDLGDYQICIPPLLSSKVPVYLKPKLQLHPSHIIRHGDSVTLKANSLPSKEKIIQFLNEHNQIIHSGIDSEYTIPSVTQKDAQKYYCICKLIDSKLTTNEVKLFVQPLISLELLDKSGEPIKVNSTVKFIIPEGASVNDIDCLICNDAVCQFSMSSLSGKPLLTVSNVKEIGQYKVKLKDGSLSLPATINSLAPSDSDDEALDIFTAELTANKNILVQGEILILNCQVSKECRLEWYLNGSQLIISDDTPTMKYEQLDKTHILIINNVSTIQHTGDYVCKLNRRYDQNPVYSNTLNILVVSPKIEFESQLKAHPNNVEHGQSIHLACKLKAPIDENVKVDLILNGKPFKQIFHTVRNDSELMFTIPGARPSTHTGFYQCVFTDARVESELAVSSKADVTVSNLMITPEYQQINDGDVLTLNANTEILSSLKWYHDNNVIPDEHLPLLRIMNVGAKNSGKYFCELEAEKSNTAEVSVVPIGDQHSIDQRLQFLKPLSANTQSPQEGSTLILSCTLNKPLNKIDEPFVKFYRLDGKPISSNAKLSVDNNEIKLTLDKCLAPNDSAVYNVSIRDLINDQPIDVEVKKSKGEILLQLRKANDTLCENAFRASDGPLDLICTSKCASNVVDIWKDLKPYKSNVKLDGKNMMKFPIRDLGTFYIKDKDGNVSNEVNVRENELQMIGPLKVVSPNNLIKKGQHFQMTCLVKGIPASDISGEVVLLKDDNPLEIPNTLKRSSIKDEALNVVFEFNDALPKLHDGVYTCMLKSTGMKSNSVNVNVMDEDKAKKIETEEQQQFLVPLKDLTVLENDSFTLTCELKLKPKSEPVWARNGKTLHLPNDDNIIMSYVDNNKLILNVRQASISRDTGEWKCQVDNLLTSCKVNVIRKNKFIEKIPEQLIIDSSQPLLLECLTTSDNPPVDWKVDDGLPVKSICQKDGDNFVNKLLIAHPHDGMIIECKCGDEQCFCRLCESDQSAKLKKGDEDDQIKEDTTDIKFVVPLKNKSIFENDTAEFWCALNKPNVNVVWKINGIPVEKDEEIFTVEVNEFEHKLCINPCTADLQGEISCQVLDDGPCSTAKLDVKDMPVKTIEGLKDVIVNEDEDAKFTAKLNKPIKPSWLKDDKDVAKVLAGRVDSKTMPDNCQELLIRKCKPTDEGWYKLLFGDDFTQAKLTVIPIPPKFVVLLKDTTAKVRDKVRLVCHLLSSPTPLAVIWFKDDAQLLSSSRLIKIQSKKLPSTEKCLQEHSIEFEVSEEMRGKFECVVSDYTDVRTSCQLNVTDEDVVFLEPLKDVTVHEKETATFCCRISDIRKPVDWYIDGKKLPSDNRLTPIVQSEENTLKLLIANCRKGDEAVYSVCIRGTNIKSTAKLVVIPQEIEFVVPLKNRVASEGDKVDFWCALSVPNAKVVWKINGKPISNKNATMEVNEFEHKLCINPCTADLQGEISCQVLDDGPCSTAKLDVKDMPVKTIEGLKDVIVNEDEDAKFTAKLNKPIKPSWLKDDKDVAKVLAGRVDSKTMPDNCQELLIRKCKPTDEGWYKLLFGDDFTQAKLTVIPIPPKFVVLLKDTTAKVRDKVRLVCHLLSSPTPLAVIWFKDDAQLLSSSRLIKIQSKKLPSTEKCLQEHSIEFEVSEEMRGKFECVVSDYTDVRTSCQLNVSDEDVVFLEPLKDVTVHEKETATFCCRISDIRKPVDWYIDGKKLPSDNRLTPIVQSEENTLKLLIANCRKGDEAVYSVCIRGTNIKSTAKLVVIQPVVGFLSPLPEKMFIRHGEPFKLQCIVSDPNVELNWLKDGEKIDPSSKHFIIDSDQFARTLSVPDGADTSDESVYTACIVDGPQSSCDCLLEDKISSLIVPKIIIPCSNVEGKLHNPFEFKCKVKGSDLEVVWLKDGQRLIPNSIYQIYQVDDMVYLRKMNCEESDEGRYECYVSNSVGEDHCAARLNLKDYIGNPPTFIQKPTNLVLNPGGNAIFTAVVRSTPLADVTWYLKGHPLKSDSRISIQSEPPVTSKNQEQLQTFILSISDIRPNDFGTYESIAENAFGNDISSATLSQESKIDDALPDTSLPRFIRPPRDLVATEGQDAKFDMFIDGEPMPDISWKKNGIPLDPSDFERLSISTEPNGRVCMIVKSAELNDAGHYEICLSNLVGSVTAPFSMQVEPLDKVPKSPKRKVMFDLPEGTIEPPLPPENPKLSNITAMTNKWQLSWDPSPSDCTEFPVCYIIELKEPGTPNWIKYRSKIKNLFYEISDLPPMRNYSFRVKAENAAGISDPSPIVRMPLFPIQSTDRLDETQSFVTFEDAEQLPSLHRVGEDVQYFIEGQDVDITLLCLGHSLTEVTWLSSEPLVAIDFDKEARFSQVSDRLGYQTLHIKNAKLSDAGAYTIRATNEYGSAAHTIYLELADPPMFIEPLKDVNVPLYDNFELTCKLDGIPYPEVDFFKDGKLLAESHRIKLRQLDGETWQITLRQAILKDSGLYTCRISNIAGSAVSTALVCIEEDTLNIPRPDLAVNFTTYKARKLDDDFELAELIHENQFSQCYKAIEKNTGNEYIAKIAKNSEAKAMQSLEAQSLNAVFSDNISKPKALYDISSNSSALILDRAPGLKSAEFISMLQEYDEYTVAKIIRQVLESLAACHAKNIAHLNIKPENVIVEQMPDDYINVRLIGFTHAQQLQGSKRSYSNYGSPEYISPEAVHKTVIGLPSDMWSIGSLTYAYLSGKSPFIGGTDTLQNIYQAKWEFNDKFDKISSDAKDFIKQLLVFDPFNRMTVTKALQHPWLKFADQKTCQSKLPSSQMDDICSRSHSTGNIDGKPNTIFDLASRSSSVEPRSREKISVDYNRPQSLPKDYHRGSYLADNYTFKRTPGNYLLPITDANFAARIRGYRRSMHSPSKFCDFHTAESVAYPETIHERTVLRNNSDNSYITLPRVLRNARSTSPWFSNKDYSRRPPTDRVLTSSHKNDVKVHDDAPVFVIPLKQTPIVVNETVQLSCQIQGKPMPTVSWYHNGSLVDSSVANNMTIADRITSNINKSGVCTLSILRALLTDLGEYQCKAVNKFGQSVTSCILYLGENPDQPKRPIVVDTTSTEAFVVWQGPSHYGNVDKINYKVDYREEGEVRWTNAAFTVEECCIVKGLRPNSEYRFRIACVNAIGISDYSVASEIAHTCKDGLAKELCVDKSHSTCILNTQCLNEELRNANQVIDALSELVLLKTNVWDEYEQIDEIYSSPISALLQVKDKSSQNKSESCTRSMKMYKMRGGADFLKSEEYENLRRLRGMNSFVHISAIYDVTPDSAAIIYSHNLTTILDFFSFRSKYTEDLVSKLMLQAVQAIEYLHNQLRCIHGNLSVLSLLVETGDVGGHLRIADIQENNGSYLQIPLLAYASPEHCTDSIDVTPASDIWSLGSICFTLLSGQLPFDSKIVKELKDDILQNRVASNLFYTDVSKYGTSFVLQCMQPSIKMRPSAADLAYNMWFSEEYQASRERSVFASDFLCKLNICIKHELNEQTE